VQFAKLDITPSSLQSRSAQPRQGRTERYRQPDAQDYDETVDTVLYSGAQCLRAMLDGTTAVRHADEFDMRLRTK
jgi:hypothetical protein